MSNFFAKLVAIVVVGLVGIGAAHAESAKEELARVRAESKALRAEKAELKAQADLVKARAGLAKLKAEKAAALEKAGLAPAPAASSPM